MIIVILGFVIENYKFVFVSVGSMLVMNVECGSVVFYVRVSVKVCLKVGVIMSFLVWVYVNCDFIVKFLMVIVLGSVIIKICNFIR